jgi:hypothetical protein
MVKSKINRKSFVDALFKEYSICLQLGMRHCKLVTMNLYERSEPATELDFIRATEEIDRQLAISKNIAEPPGLWRHMTAIARIVAPLDMSTGELLDPDGFESLQRAVGCGGLIGYYLSLYAYNPARILSHDIIDNSPAKLGLDAQGTEARTDAAHDLVDEANSAVDTMGERVSLRIDEYAELSTIDVKAQNFFRVGCGVVAIAARTAFDNENMKRSFALFRSQLNLGVPADWSSMNDKNIEDQ